MKIYTSTKVRFLATYCLLFGGLLSHIYFPNFDYSNLMIIGGALLNCTFPQKGKSINQKINIYQFFSILSLMIILFWLIISGGVDITTEVKKFFQENKTDYKLILLLITLIISTVTHRYLQLKELTNKDIIDYYES